VYVGGVGRYDRTAQGKGGSRYGLCWYVDNILNGNVRTVGGREAYDNYQAGSISRAVGNGCAACAGIDAGVDRQSGKGKAGFGAQG
jgi:hypothetical protein